MEIDRSLKMVVLANTMGSFSSVGPLIFLHHNINFLGKLKPGHGATGILQLKNIELVSSVFLWFT